MQVQKGQQNKNCGTKIGGDSRPLGDGDPKCKCKKVSGTKTAEQKWQNKNYSLFRVTQTKIGGDSASAKRSAEQKLVGGKKKVSRTKIGERNKERVSRTKIGERNKKRSAEQKLVSRTKMMEQKLVGRTKKRSVEQKLVSRTKTAEQKLVGGTKKRSAEQKLVSTVSGTKIIYQVMW